ncbi:TetR/AcrR family transcriptional regulator [Patulibacter sp. S7RM1-6]
MGEVDSTGGASAQAGEPEDVASRLAAGQRPSPRPSCRDRSAWPCARPSERFRRGRGPAPARARRCIRTRAPRRSPGIASAPDSTTEDPATGAARLSRDVILDAADRVARERGAAGLTMRRLAQELGVSGMAAYRYVGGRDELGALLLDRLFAEALDALGSDAPLRELLEVPVRALRRRAGLGDELDGPALVAGPHVARWYALVEERAPGPGARAALWIVRGAAREADTTMPWLRHLADALDDDGSLPAADAGDAVVASGVRTA